MSNIKHYTLNVNNTTINFNVRGNITIGTTVKDNIVDVDITEVGEERDELDVNEIRNQIKKDILGHTNHTKKYNKSYNVSYDKQYKRDCDTLRRFYRANAL